METLIVPEAYLESCLAKWEPNAAQEWPSYRFAKCWGCGRTLFFGMWHVFFRKVQREAHLCNRCAKPFKVLVVCGIAQR